MNTFTKFAAGTIAGLMLVSAQAAEEDKKHYLDVLGTFGNFDRDRLVDDGFAGASLRIGTAVSERWNLEAAATAIDVDGDASKGGVDFDDTTIGANALAVFNRGGSFQPFLLGGLGFSDSKFQGSNSKGNPYLDAGLGAFIPMFDNAVRLRAEAVYRAVDNSLDSRDVLLNVGLSIPFGKKAAAPVAVATAAAVVVDTDGDGVADAADQCPNTVAGATVDARGCELDGDGDGVVDRLDQCPNTPAGVEVDEVGCKLVTVVNLEGVNFRTNSAELVGGAAALLDVQAETLRENPDIDIEVAGHTDSSGNDDYNMNLSQQRADTVRTYLISKGVDADRISARGYGETQPIASNADRDGMAANRRVELRITDR